MDVELNLRISLGRGELTEVDDRLFVLLQAVDDYGSLRQASEASGLSYRAAWGLLREWTERLGTAPVDLQRGRGALLTELGRRLLWARDHAAERLSPDLHSVAGELSRTLESISPDPGVRRLSIHASHSMAQGILKELAVSMANLELDFHNHGSLDSLRALNDGVCELAGFHLVDGSLRRPMALRCRQWLDADRHCLIRVASRQQGVMMRREIADKIKRVSDLCIESVRFVNRQQGSGTRMLFDLLLDNASVDVAAIHGYGNEEFTHSAVAALLKSGAANAGFGVEAAAVRFGLEFLPVATETYYFAVGEDTLRSNPAAQHMLSVIASSEFRDRVSKLSGYDPRFSGRRETVSGILD